MTGEHYISPGDYMGIDNSADTTFISQMDIHYFIVSIYFHLLLLG